MKRKTLFKRLSSVAMALLLSLSALTQGITASAFSDTNKATQQWLNEWSYDFRGSGLPNGYDIETGKSNDTHFTGYWASSVPYFSTSDGSYAYCINFDKLHTNGTTSKQQTLADYVKGAHVPDSMQRQIKEFCIYSYKGKTQYGYSKDTEICASSIMAQAVSARYYDESTTGLSNNETKLINSYYYNGNNASAHHQELVECYKKMKSEMVSHHDVPSGTSKNSKRIPASATYPAKYDVKTGKWTATVKLDSLSQFSVSKPNSVTVTRSGSNMTITADKAEDLKNVVFTLTKTKGKYVEHIDECSPLILSGGSDVQEMVVSCYEDKDPVKAYIKLKIDMPTGNADLQKNFIDFFGNEETNVADKLKAVKFNLVMKNGDSDLFIKATGSDGKYTFSSTVSQANATDMTLDTDGNIHVSGLPQGSYYWKETTTANGYALKTKTDVTVEADKTSKTVVDNQRTSVDKGELVIYKTDESGKKYLSGAKFEITAAEDIVVSGGITIRKKGDIIDTVTTDENGKAVITKDIYQGYSYTVTEIEAPKGYSLNSEPQTVKIATDTADFGSEVSVKNSPWTAPFIITKKNLGGELLPNCEFEILDENKSQITTGITDENGIATFSLGYGKYFYHEIAAPEEYIIDDTLYPFEITEEGVSVYAKMTNYLKEGSIKVTKSTTGNLNIKDIRFVVKGISDTNSDIERELFTDENGEALFENLPIGKYTVTEDGSTVPYGYLVADSKQVTVAYAQTVDTDMVNEKVLDTKQADVYRHSLDSVVQFVVSQRCNLSGKIDLHTDVDVSALDLIKNARDMILFSRAVQHAAKDTLFEIEKEVIAIDRKNEALDNAKTAKQESTSDRVDDILQDLIKLKFSQEQILALKQAVVAAAQNGEHNIRHWVSVRYSPDELRHISSLLSDYYAQSVIEQTLDPKGILNDYYTYVNELNGRLKLSDMFSHHDYSDEQKAMLQQGFSEGISITVLNEVDERLTVDEIKTFFEMFHQAVDGQIDPHDVQIYLDKAVIEHSKQNVQTVEVQDNSADTMT